MIQMTTNMTEILTYLGKTAIVLAVFYMFYRLLLSKETFHRLNRMVLLGTAALSFILPLCVITVRKVVTLPYAAADSSATGTSGIIGQAIVETPHEPWWPMALCVLYAAGAAEVLIMTAVSVFKVKAIIGSGEHHRLESGETLVITDTDTAPFSWMNFIVLSHEDYENNHTEILTHEKAHIALRHSRDLLFVDMITALQWFNPAIWMLRSDLRALHEFEADDAVLRSGADIKEYQYLLIRKAVSKSGYSVANSFNHSTLKQRITMMLNKKSSRMSAWKALYVIPLIGLSLAATAETKVDYRYEGYEPEAVADTLDSKDSENWYKIEHKETDSSAVTTISKPKSAFTQKNLYEGKCIVDKENNTLTLIYFDTDGKERQAHYTGLDLNKDIYMHNGAIVTKEMQMKAAEDDPEAVIIVSYLEGNNRVKATITTSGLYVTGKVEIRQEQESDPIKLRQRDADGNEVKVDPSKLLFVIDGKMMPAGFDLSHMDQSDIESITVLKDEEARAIYGENVEGKDGAIIITTKSEEQVPDIFIDGKKATSEELAALPDDVGGYIEPDGTMQIVTKEEDAPKKALPTFNGGTGVDFSKWVQANVTYPEGATKEGMVTVSFTVTKKGKVKDAKVIRGLEPILDEEAVKVILSSPEWEPAIENGKPEDSKMVIPVQFTK